MSEDRAAHLDDETTEAGPPCFWSYAREDDARIGGKLSEVSEDLSHFYKFETGKTLSIFRDVESIAWGQPWEDRISHGLQNVMFLIPAVTPNFLNSEACRAEVRQFDAVCRARGVQNLILPIVFSGRHLIRKDSDDEIAQLLAKAQCTFFDEVWFTARTGEPWMRAVREMVLQLIGIEGAAEEQLSEALIRQVTESGAATMSPERVITTDQTPARLPIDLTCLDDDEDDDELQLAELAEALETKVVRSTGLLTTAFDTFQTVSELIKTWGDGQPAMSNPKAANQHFFRIASELSEPGKVFYRAAAEAYNATLESDTVIRQIQQLGGEMSDPTLRDNFNASITAGLGDITVLTQVVDGVDDLLPQMADVERYSALLKKSLKPVRNGMRTLRDTTEIILSWQREAARSLSEG